MLEVNAISKRFGGIAAVTEVSFTALPGHVTSVIGPNGAGKTTLLNLVSGVLSVDGGRVRLNSKDVTSMTPHQIAEHGMTRTFQSPQLFDGLSVLETVMVGAHSRARTGFFAAMLRSRRVIGEEQSLMNTARDALMRSGVPEHIFDRVALDLPYGLQRRIEIARAVATGAQVILLDEPAAGLNGLEVEDIVKLLESLRDDGRTVVLVEHKMEMVMNLSDHVVVMNFGAKISEGTPAQVQGDPLVIEAYLGTEEAFDA